MEGRALVETLAPALRAVRPDVLAAWEAPTGPVERKEDGTYVTGLDRRIEDRLCHRLLDLDPSWGVVGEEGGVHRAGSPTWYVDPLDGTLNFLRKIPLFAVQMALVADARPLVGMIYDPLSDTLSWAAAGEGAWREGRRLEVSRRGPDELVLLADVSNSGIFVYDPEVLPRLRVSVLRMRSLGSVAVHLETVASGRAEAYVASRAWPSNRHDFAPGALLVREAGGLVTNFAGDDVFEDARTLLAAPAHLHPRLRAIVGGTESGPIS